MGNLDHKSLFLIERKDELFMKGKPGLLISLAFQLRMLLGATACVDGIPYRRNKDGEIELMALRRAKGAFPGKLVLIGGTIAKGESVTAKLSRCSIKRSGRMRNKASWISHDSNWSNQIITPTVVRWWVLFYIKLVRR